MFLKFLKQDVCNIILMKMSDDLFTQFTQFSHYLHNQLMALAKLARRVLIIDKH